MLQMTSKKWSLIVFASLAVNVFLVWALVADKLFNGHRPVSQGMVYSVPWAVRVIGREVRPQARENFMARRDQIRQSRKAMSLIYTDVNTALKAVPFDRQVFSASLSALREKTLQRQVLIHDSMTEFVAGLTRDQRLELSNSVEKWKERRSKKIDRRLRSIEGK